ncbi:ABC transporter ATP-binding protein [Methanococcoides sp. NM1]|uniref:ABC transporter ATP-binding protein n=1 Tax=Methanococcoides sp. NM1 TaxID=1201013 RepID=UPI001082972B|nr:ABC transporter ATP-binding protein [Methanococcoides sp. NM1]
MEYEYPIIVNELTKKFGKQNEIVAVNSLSFKVNKGEIFGFIGPNGAGKTTTMKMLIGLLEPTGGEGHVAGFDIVKEIINIRQITGVLPEPAGYYDDLTARQNLRFYASFYDIPDKEYKIEKLLELLGLSDAIDQKLGGFSTGMRKRFGLAQALVNDPEIVFLDEPTSGIDPEGAQMMRNLIVDLSKNKGATVFLSSHSMEEVEEICDRVAIIKKGSLRAIGSKNELREMIHTINGVYYKLEVEGKPLEELAAMLSSINGVISANVSEDNILLHTKTNNYQEIAKTINSNNWTILKFAEEELSLHDIFLQLIAE